MDGFFQGTLPLGLLRACLLKGFFCLTLLRGLLRTVLTPLFVINKDPTGEGEQPPDDDEQHTQPSRQLEHPARQPCPDAGQADLQDKIKETLSLIGEVRLLHCCLSNTPRREALSITVPADVVVNRREASRRSLGASRRRSSSHLAAAQTHQNPANNPNQAFEAARLAGRTHLHALSGLLFTCDVEAVMLGTGGLVIDDDALMLVDYQGRRDVADLARVDAEVSEVGSGQLGEP